MAKKQVLTPAEEAVYKAKKVAALREQIKALETEQETLETELRAFLDNEPEANLQYLKAERRANPATLVGEGLTDKELEYAKGQLALQVPEFVKSTLDVSKIFVALKTNVTLANALQSLRLSVSQSTKWQFKLVK